MKLDSKWTLGLVAALALAAGAWVGWNRLKPVDVRVEALWAAEFTDLSGKQVPLASFKGQPLVINFWATWCAPCKEEMPDFQRLTASDLGKRVKVIGIGIDNAPNMSSFAMKTGITYPLLVGGPTGLDLLKSLGNTVGGLPYTVVVDGSGMVVTRHLGRMSAEALQQAATAAEAGKPVKIR
jgi:thiol-disulfide isomerase/thioredoxin